MSNAQHRRGLLKAAMMAKSPAPLTIDHTKNSINTPKVETEDLLTKGAIFDYMPWSKKGTHKKRSLTSSRYGNRLTM